MTYRYVLIDTCQRMRFFQSLNNWNVSYRSLFDGHPEESFLDIAPLLVDVSGDNEASQRTIEEAANLGKRKPCVSRLESSLPLQALTNHLKQFHLVRMPDHRMMVMRWYDTRILPKWLSVLDPHQQIFFTRNVTAWSYFDRFGEYQSLPLSTKHSTESTITLPFELTPLQSADLFSVNEPDVLIGTLREIIPDELASFPYARLHPFIDQQLKLSHQHGLREKADHIDFLMLSLYSSGKFISHPIVQPRLAQVAQLHQQSFSEWASELPEDVMTQYQPLWNEHSSNN